MNKITLIGDIVCDRQMLKNAKIGNTYDFEKMFSPLIDFFKDSDYVIANLETSISDGNYTKSIFSFSNPEELVVAIKKIGIDAVSIANNHILDRGTYGVESTIKYLNKNNIKYFGLSSKENKYGILNLNLKEIKLSVLGYTDSTNYHINKYLISDDWEFKVNLLKSQKTTKNFKTNSIIKRIYHKLTPDTRIIIKRILHKKIKPINDDDYAYEKKYFNHIKKSIYEAKENNRYVLMYPHMGGQYNIEPGDYTKKMVRNFCNMGCDSVVITHPHIIQNMKILKDPKPVFYSIGGLVISPDSKYVLWETLPEYSLAVHYYFEKNKLKKITVSVLICISDKESYLRVYPFFDFYYSLKCDKRKKYEIQYEKILDRLLLSQDNCYKVKREYLVVEY